MVLVAKKLSSSLTWEAMGPRENVKDWVDVVWFKGYVSKHSLTMWTANGDRLTTRARLAAWGMQISPSCCLCSRDKKLETTFSQLLALI